MIYTRNDKPIEFVSEGELICELYGIHWIGEGTIKLSVEDPDTGELIDMLEINP